MMLIDAMEAQETRVVITDDGDIEHFDFITKSKKQIKGNIYLGKITRIEPSLQAAFVEYGGEKQGFLPFAEVHPDYYQIPVEDRRRLLEEVEAAAARREREADEAEAASESDAQGQQDADSASEEARNGGRRGRGRRPLRRRSVAETIDAEERVIAEEPFTEGRAEAAEEKISDDGDEEMDDADAEEGEGTEEGVTSDVRPHPRRGRGRSDDDGDLRPMFFRRYKIQEVIRPGQLVLVQVIKEERGNKGVSVSTYISLAGRYCVLMPNSPRAGGISRKIASGEDRKRLKEISEELKGIRGMNAIIRTAGIDRTRAEIKRDYEYLIKLWNQVRDDALSSIAPATVYEENDIIKRSIRDHYNGDIEHIYVEGEAAYRQAKDFMKILTPSHAARVKLYKDASPIFASYNIEPQISELYQSTAPLRSGGYIVINPTEALISIDVNSGRSTTERNVEETAYKTNLEACEEIARQLRLRNLGGLVVIDFIDMGYHKNRRNVERAMKEALRDDRARVQVSHISMFGLMELSRQRMGSSIEEATTQTCASCHGSGRVMAPETIVMQMFRQLHAFLGENRDTKTVTVAVSRHIMLELFNRYRDTLAALEQSLGVIITLELHPDDHDAVYVFKGKGGARFDSSEPVARRASSKRRNRSGRRVGGRDERETRPARLEPRETEEMDDTESEAEAATESDEATEGQASAGMRESGSKRRRRRRGRGAANRREGGEGGEHTPESASAEAMSAAPSSEENAEHEAAAPERKRGRPPKRVETEKVATVQPSAAAEAPEHKARASRERKPAPSDTFAPAAPAASKDITVLVEIPQLPPRSAVTVSPPEDTPAPNERRKGWWQRVIDN
jgi:ribonuclease E